MPANTPNIPRRNVAKGAAWAGPVLVVAAPAPAMAASPKPDMTTTITPATSSTVTGGSVPVTYTMTNSGTAPTNGQPLTYTIDKPTTGTLTLGTLPSGWTLSGSSATSYTLVYTGTLAAGASAPAIPATYTAGPIPYAGTRQADATSAFTPMTPVGTKTSPYGGIYWWQGPDSTSGYQLGTRTWNSGPSTCYDLGVQPTGTTTMTTQSSSLVPATASGAAQLNVNRDGSTRWSMAPAGTAYFTSASGTTLAAGPTATFTFYLWMEGEFRTGSFGQYDVNDNLIGAVVTGSTCCAYSC